MTTLDDWTGAVQRRAKALGIAEEDVDLHEVYANGFVGVGDLRRQHAEGFDVRHAATREFASWVERVERLEKRSEARAREGKTLLATEQRDLAKARTAAGDYARLVDDLQPVHRLTAEQRFPDHDQ